MKSGQDGTAADQSVDAYVRHLDSCVLQLRMAAAAGCNRASSTIFQLDQRQSPPVQELVDAWVDRAFWDGQRQALDAVAAFLTGDKS